MSVEEVCHIARVEEEARNMSSLTTITQIH
jgi:hypothetical protein